MPSFTPINMMGDEMEPHDGTLSPGWLSVEVPATPRKRGRKKASEITDNQGSPTPTTKSKPTPEKGTPSKRGIPSSYEEASPEDRLIIHMKDKDNKTWEEIREAWSAMTGKQVGASTLPVRYQRLKANFMAFTAEDEANILEIKRELEERFEQEKWRKISEAIEAKSGKKLPPAAIQKKYKELIKKNTSTMIIKDECGEA